MIEYIITFLGIYFLCLFKFVAGPILGTAAGYGLFEIELVTVSGMMTSVLAFTYLGEWIKQNWTIIIRKKRKRFTKKTRMIVRVWKRFGIWGIALLTPVIFTPIGGTVILTSFGINKEKIIFSMLISSLLWAIIMGLIVREIINEPFFQYLL
ncbi:MAG: hypothetical protein WD398_11695 [Cyclobacteriaceae bacterium]